MDVKKLRIAKTLGNGILFVAYLAGFIFFISTFQSVVNNPESVGIAGVFVLIACVIGIILCVPCAVLCLVATLLFAFSKGETLKLGGFITGAIAKIASSVLAISFICSGIETGEIDVVIVATLLLGVFVTSAITDIVYFHKTVKARRARQ